MGKTARDAVVVCARFAKDFGSKAAKVGNCKSQIQQDERVCITISFITMLASVLERLRGPTVLLGNI